MRCLSSALILQHMDALECHVKAFYSWQGSASARRSSVVSAR